MLNPKTHLVFCQIRKSAPLTGKSARLDMRTARLDMRTDGLDIVTERFLSIVIFKNKI